jgi:hypothetical protein
MAGRLLGKGVKGIFGVLSDSEAEFCSLLSEIIDI